MPHEIAPSPDAGSHGAIDYMKTIIEEAMAKGLLEGFSETDYHVATLLRGVMFLREGTLLLGTRDLHSVPKWRSQEVKFVRGLVPEEILLNACAEEYHHSFGKKGFIFPDFAWGVLLGPRLVEVYDYYEERDEFYAWVVGVEYEERWKNLQKLKKGEKVIFLRETTNEYDPNAIQVITEGGKELGYLRRTLAAVLAPKIDANLFGLSGNVASVFSLDGGTDWWLYVRVRKEVGGKMNSVLPTLEVFGNGKSL